MGAARAIPNDEWRALRIIVFVLGVVLLVLAAGGALNATLFAKPTTIKYLVTVGACAFVVILSTVSSPLRLLVGLAIIVAPVDFVVTFSGLRISPLIAVELLALLVAAPRATRGTAALRSVSLLFAALLVPAIAISNGPSHWLVWIAFILATGWLTYLIACEPGGPGFIATMLAISALLQAAIAIWEFKSGHQLNLYTASASTPASRNAFFRYGSLLRPSGAAPDPIGLGQILALCVPVSIALAASARRMAISIAVVAIAAVAMLGLVLSLSRLSIVGAIVGLSVALVLLPRRVKARTTIFVAAAGVVVTLVGLSVGGHGLTARIHSILHPTAAHVRTAAGDIQRTHIWAAAWQTGEQHPLAGVGLGNITKFLPQHGVAVTAAAHAHNTYLQFFAESGVIGLLGLLGLLAAAGVDLRRAWACERIWVAGAAGGLIATLLAWGTDVAVRYLQVSAIVAVLLGLIAALADRQPDDTAAPRSAVT
jgi:O-antigen ligase